MTDHEPRAHDERTTGSAPRETPRAPAAATAARTLANPRRTRR